MSLIHINTRANRRSRGFTVVELMVVIAIIAILAGLFAATLALPNDRRALNTAGVAITQFMQEVRQTAIRQGTPVVVMLGTPTGLSSGELGRVTAVGSSDGTCFNTNNTPLDTLIFASTDLSADVDKLPRTRVVRAQPSGKRHVGILETFPSDAADALCFLPSGRMVGVNGRPIPMRMGDGRNEFGGMALIEIGFYDTTDASGESYDPNRRVVYGVTLVGMVEKLDPGVTLRASSGGGEGGGDEEPVEPGG